MVFSLSAFDTLVHHIIRRIENKEIACPDTGRGGFGKLDMEISGNLAI